MSHFLSFLLFGFRYNGLKGECECLILPLCDTFTPVDVFVRGLIQGPEVRRPVAIIFEVWI